MPGRLKRRSQADISVQVRRGFAIFTKKTFKKGIANTFKTRLRKWIKREQEANLNFDESTDNQETSHVLPLVLTCTETECSNADVET